MSDQTLYLFLGSVFFTVFLLSQVLIIPTFGTNKKQIKQLNNRFESLLHNRQDTHQQLLKEQYLDNLNPLARMLESMPFMGKLKFVLEQAGSHMPAYRFVFIVIILCASSTYTVMKIFHEPLIAIAAFFISIFAPIFWIQKKRNSNLSKFEEQLPEALQMLARCLKTGYPFNQSLKIISEEMPAPVGHEFGLVFDEVNYGRNLEMAFALMLERMPSLSLSAMATSVMIQKESGGNMSEVLLKISDVLRSRFKLQRRVKTLSAEGVFSAWVLCLIPFFMYVMLSWINPEHFKALHEHPQGIWLFYVIGILELIAIFWMRKIIRIDV